MTAEADQAVGPGRTRRKLTAAEEELWVLERQAPGDPAYLVPFAVWVDGPIEVPALALALRQVVARHEILRTVVRSAEGRPVAEVLPDSAVPCPVTPVASDAEALAGARALARSTFADGELRLRATVFRVDAGRWLLVLVLHHAVCDAASLWVLLDELAALYSARVAGRAADLPAPVQFAEVRSAELADQVPAGLDSAAGAVADAVRSAPDLVNLPYDHPGDAERRTEGRLLRLPVPAELNDATDRTARRLAVSPNAVLLAAYAVLLDVIAGADDVLISVPVSRRGSPAEQGVIGFLVHSVPVRLRTGDCDTVGELARHSWAALRHGLTHAAVSFGRVVAEINPQRVPGMNPLCQCEFSVQALPDGLPALGPARLAYQFVHNGGYKFSLSLEVVRSADRRDVALEYPAAMFSAATVRRLANLYLRVLAGLTADSAGRLADLDLVSRAEQAWLTEHGGGERAELAPPPVPAPTLAARLEAMIRRHPVDEAVTAADQSLTYAELGALTGELAAALAAAGVAAGQRVAVFGERGTAAVVAVVAAIRLGASFVAIADDTPADRVAQMLAAAQPAAVVVTAARLLAALPERWRAGAVRYPDGWLLTAGDRDRAFSQGEAYVVFTSGSTGEPRGVSVPAGAITAIADAWDAEFGLAVRPGRHLQLAPFSFDVFVGDLARSLCFGGALVLAGRDDALDPRRLADLIRRKRIEVVEFVPAVARLLSDYLDHVGGGLPTLRLVMVGSDIWLVSDALRLRALMPKAARLYCTYGTSESAIDATVFGIEPARQLEGTVVPIGRPFPGVQVSVRDRLGRLLPPRWPGELWVGGATVASGYLLPSDPAADRFRTVHGPRGRPVRWYRTGDRVVWDQHGQLHLLGRIDSETKIRGVRVHLAEIEAVLCRHPAVTAAAVVAVGEGPHRMLIAFVVGPARADVDDLAAHARRHLLQAAVPAGFRVLDRIPTTRHGKVDRRALVTLVGVLATAEDERIEAAGDLERTVAGICAEVLDLPGIGALDDFYALGASSVHLARLAWRVSLAAGCQVSVREVIGAPSVRALCRLIDGRSAAGPAGSDRPDAGAQVVAVGPPSASERATAPPRRVVLTGVTGRLGPGILRALLDGGADEVACLVRADDIPHARARVRTALAGYGADPLLAENPRLRYCIADLALPNLGLSAADIEAVTGADTVVNAAAWVNFLYPYELLVPVNVHGVATLARLAGQGRIKPLHHLSTRSAVPADGRRPAGGYNESKAGAERMLARCRELGLPVCVYRPGFVLGSIPDQPVRPGLLESFLRECVRLGAFPALPGYLNVVSADHVTVRIVDNVLSPRPSDCLDLVGSAPLPWPAAWETLRGHGVELEETSERDWLGRVAERTADAGWFEPFLPLCESAGLPALLSDGPEASAGPGAQSVAQAWRHICAQLAELAGYR